MIIPLEHIRPLALDVKKLVVLTLLYLPRSFEGIHLHPAHVKLVHSRQVLVDVATRILAGGLHDGVVNNPSRFGRFSTMASLL